MTEPDATRIQRIAHRQATRRERAIRAQIEATAHELVRLGAYDLPGARAALWATLTARWRSRL